MIETEWGTILRENPAADEDAQQSLDDDFFQEADELVGEDAKKYREMFIEMKKQAVKLSSDASKTIGEGVGCGAQHA